uniref:Small ribosomal subunit protein mS35 mitochondrial conserved domain-containing protein n=1 Tax=Oryza punctata TaxID=4537 RepID=A0A0E0LX26_ORYPU
MRRFVTHLHRLSQRALPSPPPSRPPTAATTTSLPFLLSRRLLSEDAAPPPPTPPPAADVPNKELKRRLETYYKVDDEAELPSVTEAVLERKLADVHSATDDELIEELRSKPLPEVRDRDFESDFEEMHDTDEELDNLYNARQYVEKKIKSDEFFNMDDNKWNEMIKKAVDNGHLSNMKECENILEDMLHWDKLLPDEIKKKVEAKFNELGDMCEKGGLEPEQAYELFKEFEDKMVSECTELMEAENPTDVDEFSKMENKSIKLDDPPGEGPVLRWESRIVFAPGGDAWHPKNRKVELSVTVKELGLSRHAFRRFREVVGNRYNSGKDELTITSERFEHREENRKDCLRTLYAVVEDANKANKLAEDARNAYVKNRLKGNAQFMERFKMKTQKLRHPTCTI